MHLTDEDLIAHCYGERRTEGESAVDAHLESCADCRALWQEIASTLEMVDSARVPEPDEGFEQRMWARIQPALSLASAEAIDDGPRLRGGARILNWLLPAAGLAAAVLIALLIGHPWRVAPATVASGTVAPPASPPRAAADPAGRERVLLTALNDHFQRSEMLLVEVMNGGSASDELGFERQAADDLLDSSRLYRATAQQNGNVRLAEMLEEIESVLVEIARSPEKVDRGDIRALRARIDEDNLLFKVRAVSGQIQARQRSLSTE